MLKLTSIHLMGLSTGPQLSRTKALNSHWNDCSLCLKLTFLDLKLSPIFFPLILIFIILSIPFFSPNNSLLFPNPTFFSQLLIPLPRARSTCDLSVNYFAASLLALTCAPPQRLHFPAYLFFHTVLQQDWELGSVFSLLVAIFTSQLPTIL